MRHHNPGLWIIILVVLIGSILLFAGGPEYDVSRSRKHLWDLGHVVYFAAIALLLSRWRLLLRMSLPQQWIVILTVTLLIGVAVEYLQSGISRSPTVGDILRDLTGSLLVLVYGPLRIRLQPIARRLTLQIVVSIVFIIQLWPLTRSLIDEVIAWSQFPLLSGFETPFEIDRWEGGDRLSVESISPFTEGKFLKLLLTTEKYSGVKLKYFDGDWTAARTLNVSFYNPDSMPLRIICRIHDHQHLDGDEEYHDRFNRGFMLKSGWNRIAIDLEEVKQSPAGRSMDMRRIRGVMFFVESLPSPRTLYVDDVRLDPKRIYEATQ